LTVIISAIIISDMYQAFIVVVRFFQERVDKIRARLDRIPVVHFATEVMRALGKDDAGIMAAGLSYYTFLSLFPLILGMISILGFFLPSEKVQSAVFDFLQENIPVSIEILRDNIQYVIQIRGALGLVGIIGLLIGALGIFSAVSRVVNRAWNVRPRPLHLSKPLEFAMLVGSGILLVILFLISSGISLLNQVLPFIHGGVVILLTQGISFCATFGVLLLIYRFIPNTKVYWSDVWRGALLVAILFHAVLFGFSLYVQNFTDYQVVYGSIGAIIAILVWIYYSAFIVIVGAEFNYVFSRLHGKARTKA
jgi:membrane protein